MPRAKTNPPATFGSLLAANGTGRLTNPLYSTSLQDILDREGGIGFVGRLIPNLVGLALLVGVLVFLFVFLIGAIQWISSGGDKATVEAARSRISNALVGLVVMFSTFAIISLIEFFFNINILTLDIGPLRIQ